VGSSVPLQERITNTNSRSYIANLDADCVLALAATVPRVQAALLRDFCYKHLAFRSFIGGEISVSVPTDPKLFRMPVDSFEIQRLKHVFEILLIHW
jgi:hypothetical protein